MSINRHIRLPVGELQIYVDPRDQEKAKRLIKSVPSIMTKGYENGCNEFANQLLRVVRRSLSRGMPPPHSGVSWPPHSIHTIKRYGPHPLLNLTGQYMRSVGIFKNKLNHNIYVGLPNNVKKSKPGNRKQGGTSTGKLTLNQIAAILEYGTDDMKIPPRPLWRPAWDSVGGKRVLRDTIIKNVRKEIQRVIGKGGIRNAKF